MARKLSAVLISLSLTLSGCYTAGMIEKRGFMSEGFAMPPELGNPPDNPSIIVRISPLANGTSAGAAHGARAGADVGNVATTMGGGDPLSAIVGLGVGIVASGLVRLQVPSAMGKLRRLGKHRMTSTPSCC